MKNMELTSVHRLISVTLYFIIIGFTEGAEPGWTICTQMPKLFSEGVECPYSCLDFFLDDVACKDDGVTPISCSSSFFKDSCASTTDGSFNCERSMCMKLPCYEPNTNRYAPPAYNINVCKRRKIPIIPPSILPRPSWETNYGLTTDKPRITRRRDILGAVWPIMITIIVIVTVIMVLRCFMRSRQARQFQGTSSSSRPNVTLNPVYSGTSPPYSSSRHRSETRLLTVMAPPSAPYQGQHFTRDYRPNRPFLQHQTHDDLPPSYSPPKDQEILPIPDGAPPSYFEATRETQAGNTNTNYPKPPDNGVPNREQAE